MEPTTPAGGPRDGPPDEPPDGPAAPPTYTCPHCGEAFALAAAPADRIAQCPACNTQFFVATEDDSWRDDGEDEDEDEKKPEPEFNDVRIKQLAGERKALIRTRSYVIVATVAVVVIAGQFVWQAVKHVWVWDFGWGLKPVGYLFGALACAFAFPMLRRKLQEIDRELAEAVLPEPETPPDLSTLSDGTEYRQRFERNLEWLQNRGRPGAGNRGSARDDESAANERTLE